MGRTSQTTTTPVNMSKSIFLHDLCVCKQCHRRETWRTRGQREAPLNMEKLVAQFNVLRVIVDQKRAVCPRDAKIREEEKDQHIKMG